MMRTTLTSKTTTILMNCKHSRMDIEEELEEMEDEVGKENVDDAPEAEEEEEEGEERRHAERGIDAALRMSARAMAGRGY